MSRSWQPKLRSLGSRRRTIHRWIESGQLDVDLLSSGVARYSPRPRIPHKLDPYKELIVARLEEFPKLSAQRSFDEVRSADYEGGYSRVSDYVREVGPRLEPPSGAQGQPFGKNSGGQTWQTSSP